MARHRRRAERRPRLRVRRRGAVGVALLASTALFALASTTQWRTASPSSSDPARLAPQPAPPAGTAAAASGSAAPPAPGAGTSAPGSAVASPGGSSGGTPGTPPTAGAAPAADGPVLAGGGPQTGAQLLWSDEFDGPAGSLPDRAIWTPSTGHGWGNGELQCYTSAPRNLGLDGAGQLVITAVREPSCDGAPYSSARIETRDLRTVRYGYIEVRATLPTARGTFPAVWMLGAGLPAVGWPASGELDIVEVVSSRPTTVHTNIHGVDRRGGHWQAGWPRGGMFDAGVDLGSGLHTYGVEWSSSRLRFYFDGEPIRTIDRDDVPVWLWDGEYYLLLNVAIDRNGAQARPADYPQQMIVDYVRVYDSRPS